jgi:hypothetical protein
MAIRRQLGIILGAEDRGHVGDRASLDALVHDLEHLSELAAAL